MLLRFVTGAVNRETNYTYIYLLPLTGKLHYLTDGVNQRVASFTRGVQMVRCCRTYAVRTVIAKRLVAFDIRTGMTAEVLNAPSS